MIYEFLQIKSTVESIESDSRKVCYLCLPKSQWITNDKEELTDNNLCEMESVNE
jgi:hypothetical protein